MVFADFGSDKTKLNFIQMICKQKFLGLYEI